MNYPKISIVTPSYNQGEFLEDTIVSVLGQFYPNLEYLIFDGGSEDNSVSIIRKYQGQLTYWESNKDNGQADAINRGFARSTGEIMMWLNSDDVLMPNVLHYIADLYTKQGDGIYFGNCIHFKELDPNGVFATGSNVIADNEQIDLELADPIIQPSSFWSRRVWLENGILEEQLHYGFDWEWFLRAKKKHIPFYSINKPLSLYRFHPTHKSGVGGKERQKELLSIYEKHSSRYADLYRMMIEEKVKLSFFEKILFHLYRKIFDKSLSKLHFLKLMKKEQFQAYTVKEIQIIQGML